MPEFEPKSRNEALLNAIANGQESTIVPQSRNEFLLSEISKKQVPEFTPHTRIEALLMEVAKTVAEGGGGNPNRVQTVTGTLAEPFGNVNFSELMSALSNGNATAVISFVFSGQNVELFLKKSDGFDAINGTYCEITDSNYLGADVFWYPTPLDYSVGYARAVGSPTGQIVDLAAMTSGIESALTIIWHPLPEA